MAEFATEILCIMVLSFLAVMFFHSKKIDKNNRIFDIFSRLLIASIINLLMEIMAAYSIMNEKYIANYVSMIIFEAYYISLLCVIFLAFLYIRHLINLDLPSLKKIGNWTSLVVAVLAVILQIVPLFIYVRDQEFKSPGKDTKYIFVIALIMFFFFVVIFFSKYKYINSKRRGIIFWAFLDMIFCMVLQYLLPDYFMVGIGITMLAFSLYMTMENEDVKLIELLAAEKEKSDEANKSKTTFVANLSHEIRTPINAILGMDELILRETKDEVIKRYAIDIRSATHTLHEIIKDILDTSKLETGVLEIEPVNYSMSSIINDIVNIIQLKMNIKKLEFVVDIDPDMPAGYYGDAMRIKQILTNILSNAFKYTNTGTVVFKMYAERIPDKKAKIYVSVKDTGIGMKEEELDNLFSEYARLDSKRNRTIEGTGLGMPITMKLLNMMGSELEVESEYNKGSTFKFAIVQDIWDESPIGNYMKANYDISEDYKYEKSFEAPETKVLVVDDNTINRKVFIGLLKETGMIIDEADSGERCLELVEENEYRMIFMDHMMPIMDGVECFHKLREKQNNMSKNAIVIMLTANAIVGARESYLNEGFDEYLSKPINPNELEDIVRKYIN